MKSRLGLILSLAYMALTALLILSQGLLGESFIAIILGLPWSLIPSFFEYNGAGGGAVLYTLILGPLLINTALFYFIGLLVERGLKNKVDERA